MPPHLAVNVRVVDAAGKELGMGRDLADFAPSSARPRK